MSILRTTLSSQRRKPLRILSKPSKKLKAPKITENKPFSLFSDAKTGTPVSVFAIFKQEKSEH
jgi:hypothetical protein